MKKQNKDIIRDYLDKDFTLFDLDKKASEIKNRYSLKKGLIRLAEFVESRKFGFN